jgi:DNA-binding NtrC family response regulator
VREGLFRQDLFYRINTIVLVVPPLRERIEDLPVLAQHFLTRSLRERGRGPVALSPEASRALSSHSWPGNVRELRNVLERALVVSDRDVIAVPDLRFSLGAPLDAPAEAKPPLTLEEIERQGIVAALQAEDGNVEATARRLAISKSGLYLRMKRYALRD